jgi:hypothetical protein
MQNPHLICPTCRCLMMVPGIASGASVSCPQCGQVLVVQPHLAPSGWNPRPRSTAILRLCTGLVIATIVIALLAAAAALACRLDLTTPPTADRLALLRKVTVAASSAAVVGTLLGLLSLLLAAAKKGRPWLA